MLSLCSGFLLLCACVVAIAAIAFVDSPFRSLFWFKRLTLSRLMVSTRFGLGGGSFRCLTLHRSVRAAVGTGTVTSMSRGSRTSMAPRAFSLLRFSLRLLTTRSVLRQGLQTKAVDPSVCKLSCPNGFQLMLSWSLRQSAVWSAPPSFSLSPLPLPHRHHLPLVRILVEFGHCWEGGSVRDVGPGAIGPHGSSVTTADSPGTLSLPRGVRTLKSFIQLFGPFGYLLISVGGFGPVTKINLSERTNAG
jgi:hypothetical protein